MLCNFKLNGIYCDYIGIGDCGLGIGQSPIPNPQSPIPIYYLNHL